MSNPTNVRLTDNEKKTRLVRIIILAAVIVAAVIILVITGVAKQAYSAVFGAPIDPNNSPAHAAEIGVMTVNTLAYGGDTAAWKTSVCQVSTTDVCTMIDGSLGELILQTVNQNQSNLSASDVEAIMMVDQTKDGNQQVWAVRYNLTSAGQTQAKLSYIIVEQVDGVWKFGYYVPLAQGILEKMYGPKLTPTATE
jgi:hypothetical protein